MDIKKVTVAGGGVLGSQIAFQSAYKGFEVTIWLRSDASIERCQPKLKRLHDIYVDTLAGMKTDAHMWAPGLSDTPDLAPEQIDALIEAADLALANIQLTTSYEKAFAEADLVIEAVAEDPEQKKEFYAKAAEFLPEHTIVVTNSSTLLPSMFAESTGRPEKFLGYHFANNIWIGNTAEIMPHPETGQDAYDAMVAYSKAIGMVPIELHVEQPGYVLNSLLVPFLDAAQILWAKDVASPEDIDIVWRTATGAPKGPFEIMDVVGLTTVKNIVAMKAGALPDSLYPVILEKVEAMIAEGKTGINAGEGFYSYK